MSVMKNFQTNIIIGGSISQSLKNTFGSLQSVFSDTADDVDILRHKQKLLNDTISQVKQSGGNIDYLEKQYADVATEIQKISAAQKSMKGLSSFLFGNTDKDYQAVSAAVKDLYDDHKKLTNEIKIATRAGQQLNFFEKKYQTISQKIADTTQKQAILLDKIKHTKQAGGSIASLQIQYDKLSADIITAKHKQQDFYLAMEKNRQSASVINRLETEYKQLSTQIGIALTKQQALARHTKASREQRQQQLSQKRDNARGDLFDSVAMGYVFSRPVASAIEFEKAMANLNKTANLSKSELQATQNEVLRLSTVMPMVATDIADIYTAAYQTGVSKDQLSQFTQSAIQMGVAFDITGKEAGQMMGIWRNSMALTQPQVISLADTINSLSNKIGPQASLIAEVVTRVGALGKLAGLSEGAVAGLATTMISMGSAPEQAATAIKNFTNSLTKGVMATKAQKDAYAQLGFNSEQLAKDMQDNAVGTVKKVISELDKISADQKSGVLSALFGEEAKDETGKLLVNTEKLVTAFNIAADASSNAGSMQREYATFSKITSAQLTRFNNSLTQVGITIGSVLLPPLNDILQVLSFVSNKFAGVAQRFPTITKYATIGATAFIGLSVAITTAFIGLSVAITAVKWASLALLSSNPFGWVILGVTAITTLGIAIYNNYNNIIQWTTSLKNSVTGLWESMISAVVGVVNNISTAIYNKYNAIIQWTTWLKDSVTGIWASMISAGVSAIPSIGTAIYDNYNKIIQWTTWLKDSVTGIWQKMVAYLKLPSFNLGGMFSGTPKPQNDNNLNEKMTRKGNQRLQNIANNNRKNTHIDNSSSNVNINITPHSHQSPKEIADRVSASIPKKTGTGKNLFDDTE